ncbi:substrate-binding domain-containing protein [Deinococcus metalli]
MAQDATRLGRMAAQLVIDAVTGTARGVGVHRLPTTLISRGSCQPPST